MPRLDGVDTSNNQGAAVTRIGPQLQTLGVDGWWHKATQSDNFRDRYYLAVRKASEELGFRYRGPYHWLQPNHDVARQFDNFTGLVGDLRLGECIQLDVEDPGGLSDPVVFEAIDYWAHRYGMGRLLVYTGRFYMPYNPTGKRVESYLIDRLIARYGDDLAWWLPWYDNTYPGNRIPIDPVAWQFAGGKDGVLIDGVGRIDSNEFIDRVRLESLCGYSTGGGGEGVPIPPKPPKPDPQPEPTPDPPAPKPEDEMGTPIGFIAVNKGTRGHHADGSVWEAPVDGTTFYVTPGGNLQWMDEPTSLATKRDVILPAAALRNDTWSTPVGDPDVFGLLVGPVPGRPEGYVPVVGAAPKTVEIGTIPGTARIGY